MLSVAVALLAAVVVHQGDAVANPDCNAGPPGLYCLNDLTGYLSCPSDGSQPVAVSCPTDTRCKCFLRSRCSDNSPCATFRRPQPWPRSFTLRYHGTRQTTNPQGTTVVYLQGMWKRDDASKKFLKWDWEGSLWKFELVVPNAQGSFYKYEGAYPSTCTRSIVNNVPDLDISLFSYVGMDRVNELAAERWDFLIGARNLGESSTRTSWYSVYDNNIKSYRPARFTEKFSGGAMTKTNVATDWTVGFYNTSAEGDAWFWVPGFCTN